MTTITLLDRYRALCHRMNEIEALNQAGAFLPKGSHHGQVTGINSVWLEGELIILERGFLWDAIQIKAPWLLPQLEALLK